jgi:hypothetical protein
MSEFMPPLHEGSLAGFNRPQTPKDDYAATLYQKFGLGQTPSLEDMEPIATRLLDDPTTIIEGMSLVLGRRVDAREFTEDPELGVAMLMGSADQTEE